MKNETLGVFKGSKLFTKTRILFLKQFCFVRFVKVSPRRVINKILFEVIDFDHPGTKVLAYRAIIHRSKEAPLRTHPR